MKPQRWLFALVLITWGGLARAGEFTEFYTGVRQLGMGGAYTAVVNDETAVLTNPAGLGKLREPTLTLIDPELSGSFNDTRIATLSTASNVINLQGLLDALNDNKGVHWNAKAQFFPSVVTSNFGFGLHAKYEYNAEVDPTGTTFRLDYTNDYAAALGYCFRFFGGVLKVGTSARLVDRTEIHQDLDAHATDLSIDGLAKEGLGLGFDVGLILSAPVQYLPALSVVARDVGGTSYELGNGLMHSTGNRPGDTPQTLDGGVAIFPILSNGTRMTITADVHDFLMVDDDHDLMKRVHAGMELNFNDFFFLRGGMNQRYWTAGVELASENFQLQAASYGEDVGAAGSPVEDRRWVTKFTFRF
jgi:hypothetical protein